jgi:hypothetical protein
MYPTRLRLAGIACAAIASVLVIRDVASAQNVTEPALKAAFIYNFAKFTDWPADAVPSLEPFVLCVIGDAAVGDALKRAVSDRMLSGHAMSVSSLGQGSPPGRCQVLYISGVTGAQAAQLVAGLRDLPVLTISDLEGFIGVGGIARFFFENGQLRFSVHLESVERAHLRISSRLLTLAVRNE